MSSFPKLEHQANFFPLSEYYLDENGRRVGKGRRLGKNRGDLVILSYTMSIKIYVFYVFGWVIPYGGTAISFPTPNVLFRSAGVYPEPASADYPFCTLMHGLKGGENSNIRHARVAHSCCSPTEVLRTYIRVGMQRIAADSGSLKIRCSCF